MAQMLTSVPQQRGAALGHTVRIACRCCSCQMQGSKEQLPTGQGQPGKLRDQSSKLPTCRGLLATVHKLNAFLFVCVATAGRKVFCKPAKLQQARGSGAISQIGSALSVALAITLCYIVGISC